MSEEVIVTLFKAETAELDAALNRVEGGLRDVTKAEADAAKAGDNLNGTMGSLAAKTAAATEAANRNAAALQRTATAARQAGQATDQAAKSGGALARAGQSIGGVFGRIGTSLSSFGQSVKAAFASATGSAGSLQKTLGSVGQEIISTASSVGGLGGSFSALLGPVGLAAAAVGAFIANFSRLDSVKTALEGINIQAGFIGDRLANLDFSGLFNPATVAQDTAQAQLLATLGDTLFDKQLDINKANAAAEVQLASLNQQLRDRTKTEQERLKIADQITAIETKRASQEEEFIKGQILRQRLANNAQQERLGEVSDDNKKLLTDLEVALANAQARSIQLTETVERRRNSIIEQGLNERQAAEAKAQAEAEKRAAAAQAAAAKREQEQQQNLQQTAQLKDKLEQDKQALEDESLRASLSRNEQEIFDIERAYDKRRETAAKLYSDLSKLAQQRGDTGEVERLAQEQATQIAAITEEQNRVVNAKVQEQLAEEQKIRVEGQRRIQDSLLTEEEREVQAVQDKYAKLIEETRKFYADAAGITDEGKRIEAELIAQRDREIEEGRAARDREAQEAQAQRQQATLGLLSDSAAQATEIVGAAAANGQLTAEEASKALTLLALDTIEKLVLMNAINAQTGAIAFGTAAGGPAGTLAGLVQGAAVAALIKGLFAALKASIQGAYTGEAFIDGPAAFPGESRDAHLRRVHYGERIVTADANRKHWDILQAVANDRVEDFVNSRYVIPAINAYMSGDTGQRMASSVMLAQYYDKNIVTELRRNREALDGLPIALAGLLAKPNARTRGHRRYW